MYALTEYHCSFSSQRNAEAGGQVHEELRQRDELIRELTKKIDALTIDVEQVEHSKQATQQALKDATQETQVRTKPRNTSLFHYRY